MAKPVPVHPRRMTLDQRAEWIADGVHAGKLSAIRKTIRDRACVALTLSVGEWEGAVIIPHEGVVR